MKAYVYDCRGNGWSLPTIVSWDMCHGFGEACDSFELEFLYTYGMLPVLSEAVEFKAKFDGRTVFRGRVDEFEVDASAEGCLVKLRGRGMQALLLDNEAESADYFGADLDYILSRHVLPLGINDIDTTGAEGTAASFSVDSGVSHWSVLRQFAEFCCGVSPRFAPDGTLVLDGESGGGEIEIGGKTPVTGMAYREDRYGVISSVRVKKYSAGVYADVENPEFIAKGGRCQRVINVPKKTGYDAMRHTGEYQIKESMKDHKLCFVTMPGCFLAFPGDRVTMRSSPIGLTGEFLVRSSRCRCDGRGAVTELEMRRI